jgi:hypothetical protein
MGKPDPISILDTAVIAGRILEAFMGECREISVSEKTKAIEFGAWLSLTAAATHHVCPNSNSIHYEFDYS